jgi:hypothetical protein
MRLVAQATSKWWLSLLQDNIRAVFASIAMHYGAQTIDKLEVGCTHLVADNPTNDKVCFLCLISNYAHEMCTVPSSFLPLAL